MRSDYLQTVRTLFFDFRNLLWQESGFGTVNPSKRVFWTWITLNTESAWLGFDFCQKDWITGKVDYAMRKAKMTNLTMCHDFLQGYISWSNTFLKKYKLMNYPIIFSNLRCPHVDDNIVLWLFLVLDLATINWREIISVFGISSFPSWLEWSFLIQHLFTIRK